MGLNGIGLHLRCLRDVNGQKDNFWCYLLCSKDVAALAAVLKLIECGVGESSLT